MTCCLATNHAIDRIRERFAGLTVGLADIAHCGRFLTRLALRGVPVGMQRGFDLMLRVTLRLPCGPQTLYLPVTPVGSGDRWLIRTVLTEEQAQANLDLALTEHQRSRQAAWRRRKGFDHPRRLRAIAALTG